MKTLDRPVTPLGHHPYADDGTCDEAGEGRCLECGLGEHQGRAAEAHTTPEDPEASALAHRILGEGDVSADDPAPAVPVQPATPDTPAERPRIGLDWSNHGQNAAIGDPKPCVDCRKPALLRDPATGRPRHKVCAEFALAERVAANTGHFAKENQS